MSTDFFVQSTNLLAQQLAHLNGEEIYQLTSCMAPDIRELIGVLEGLKLVAPQSKVPIDKLLPLISMIGKAKWERSELTDLGLRVGQRNTDTVTNTEIEAEVEDK
jgi:hypothetical protein